LGKVSEIIGISREIVLAEVVVPKPGKTAGAQNREKKMIPC
jgi:hypothetical protein